MIILLEQPRNLGSLEVLPFTNEIDRPSWGCLQSFMVFTWRVRDDTDGVAKMKKVSNPLVYMLLIRDEPLIIVGGVGHNREKKKEVELTGRKKKQVPCCRGKKKQVPCC